MASISKPLRIAIIGPGMIGCDFLVKALKEEGLYVTIIAGRHESAGLQFARLKGVQSSAMGIDAIIKHINEIDVIVDATNSEANTIHTKALSNSNKFILNMTPSGIGSLYIPGIVHNSASFIHNFATCGIQACMPIVNAIQPHLEISYLELITTLSSRSVGTATRLNINDYIETTSHTIKQLTSAITAKVILTINPSNPPSPMRVSIYCEQKCPITDDALNNMTNSIHKWNIHNNFTSGRFKNLTCTRTNKNVINIQYEVLGQGDYCRKCDGNLDIMTSAATDWCKQRAVI